MILLIINCYLFIYLNIFIVIRFSCSQNQLWKLNKLRIELKSKEKEYINLDKVDNDKIIKFIIVIKGSNTIIIDYNKDKNISVLWNYIISFFILKIGYFGNIIYAKKKRMICINIYLNQ